MQKTIKYIRLNGLQFNPNRDPQFYRRLPTETFVVEAVLNGQGPARASLRVDGVVQHEGQVDRPGAFRCELRFDTAGSRNGLLTVSADGHDESVPLRFDVQAQPWHG